MITRNARHAVTELLAGEHARSGRDFGRGVAYAARLIDAALTRDEQESMRVLSAAMSALRGETVAALLSEGHYGDE